MNAKITPEEMVARLIYRDGLMLVIDKPSGYAVHRGPKGGESLEDHFGALRFGLPRAPALAHRLDRDTSGCLVLGRHRKALAELGRLFKAGRIGKTYWAVVEGGPTAEEGRIEMPLGRRDETRGWWMKPDPHGQPAVTLWRVLGRSFVACTDQAAGALEPQRSLPPSRVEDGHNRPDVAEGTGPGIAANSAPASTPLPNPPPASGRLRPSSTGDGGREQSGASGGGSGSPPTGSSPIGQLTWL
ncbi:MAG: tRNA pseudouridine32 synthase / rRNA pseudouridine746 synthase, partial [Alphaproteobacteria bacterium]|nr:tRNA pseudouridine32 synthase / rRNA pseudouridine746 synthase [Alphaproteobacteria bacterium]